jgi:predicted nucleic acid-binding Zn ribbon protein
MKELGPVLETLLRQKKMWNQYRQYLILEQWAEVVGKEISGVTRAEKISKGLLWVAAKDSTWVYHLTLLKPRLLEKINKNGGKKVVEDIYFHVDVLQGQEMSIKMVNNSDHDEVKEVSPLSTNNPESSFLEGIRRLKNLE